MTAKHYQIKVPNTLASKAMVAGIFDRIDEDLKLILKQDTLSHKPLLICSGGTSSRCAANDHWTLDLRKNYNFIDLNISDFEANIGAGIKMAKLINELSKYNRSFPIGLSDQTGLGYILTGGISPLSRSEGLAIDQILQIDGVWGNGENFSITKPNKRTSLINRLRWRGLCGAAPFISIVTNLKVKTYPQEPLRTLEWSLTKEDLSKAIKISERWSKYSSFQWIWGDNIKGLAVFKIKNLQALEDLENLKKALPNRKEEKVKNIDGIIKMPLFVPQFNEKLEIDVQSEVIGLLSKAWEGNCMEVVSIIQELMNQRPHSRCCIASQQLGEETTCKSTNETSFILRQSMWKPWITASWPEGNQKIRELSLSWLELAWERLEPYCPGVHLAQMHQHLNCSSKESSLAFGEWLPGLKELKRNLDPNGLLPTFL